MALEKAPAFQFYPKDFLTDSHVVAMTLQERGAYITLLCLCWLERSIPASMDALARLCRVSPVRFISLWPALEPCFTVVDGRLIQRRIERERQKQETYRALKAEAGRKGGTAKAAAKQTSSKRLAKASPPSSSSVSDLQSPTDVQEPSSASADFEAFRQAYPVSRRVGGQAVKAAFRRSGIGRNGDSLATVLLILEQQKRSEQWQNPKLIPLMTTWLNQERWIQVLPEPGASGNGVTRTADVKTYQELENERYRVHVLGEEP